MGSYGAGAGSYPPEVMHRFLPRSISATAARIRLLQSHGVSSRDVTRLRAALTGGRGRDHVVARSRPDAAAGHPRQEVR
ncbi:hypothetical protein GCM10022222_09670 [Amycolatopsis ultiminotia]|uniref:Uncharacterized protein n=1 Tax=Amycolatopsis ultiminotia TaxID=543629 RepID=A0ABP6V8A3_9PSEU